MVNKQKRIKRHGRYRRITRNKNGTIKKDISEGKYQKRQHATQKGRTTKAKKRLIKTALEQLPVVGKVLTARKIANDVEVIIKKGKK